MLTPVRGVKFRNEGFGKGFNVASEKCLTTEEVTVWSQWSVAMGSWNPDIQSPQPFQDWDTANPWLFPEVPRADKLLSEEAGAYIFWQPKIYKKIKQ